MLSEMLSESRAREDVSDDDGEVRCDEASNIDLGDLPLAGALSRCNPTSPEQKDSTLGMEEGLRFSINRGASLFLLALARCCSLV